MAASRICSVEGCDKPARARGWCRSHYRKLNTVPECSVDGCRHRSYCRGLCSLHYQRLKNLGDALAEPHHWPDICTVEGCEKPSFAKGMCSSHYRRQLAPCSIDGCGRPSSIKGLCLMHAKRVAKHGDPHYKSNVGAPLRWLLAHVDHEGEECLLWPFGCNNKGYATLSANGRVEYGHQMMCKKAHGPAPKNKPHALHSCGRGHLACIHPGHLYWGTHAENMQDRVLHGTSNRGERNWCAKLTESQVLQIRELTGSDAEIAERFGVTAMTINDIRNRRTWAWLQPER